MTKVIVFLVVIAAILMVMVGLAVWAFVRNLCAPTPLSILGALPFVALLTWLGFGVGGWLVPSVFWFGTLELVAASLGAGRRWPRVRGTLVWVASIALALLSCATLVQVFRARAPAFVEPLAEAPAGCPTDPDLPGPSGVSAHLCTRGGIAISNGAQTTTIVGPSCPSCDGPQWSEYCPPSPTPVGVRPNGGYCVGVDPEPCRYVHPHFVIVDDELRPWPSALDRLETRAGALTRNWLLFAIASAPLLLGLGIFLTRWWTRLLVSARRGELELVDGGWRFFSDGRVHTLDLRGARFVGTLAEGPCRVIARASPEGDPYRTASSLRVQVLACGDTESVAREIADRRARIWTILLALVAVVAVPVSLAILDAYRFAPAT